MAVDLIIASRAELARRFVDDLVREIRAAPSNRRRTLAIPGGSVAEAFLPALADAPLDWNEVELFWTDERAVDPASPDSNFGFAHRLWLEPAQVPPARVHRMHAEADDLEASARRYAAELLAAAGDPPRLDYVLLGAGADGHVASIFPGSDPTRYLDAPTVGWVGDAPPPLPRRMTLGMRPLADARRVVVAAFGASKARALASALHGDGDGSPLGVLLAATERPLVLLDPEAAALLRPRSSAQG